MTIDRGSIVVNIKVEWCKGCGICVAFCPKKILGLNEHMKVVMLDPEKCIKCGQCELRCPDYAIYLGGLGDE